MINLLAVVLLSGAVAIVLEGTPLGEEAPAAVDIAAADAPASPAIARATQAPELSEPAATARAPQAPELSEPAATVAIAETEPAAGPEGDLPVPLARPAPADDTADAVAEQSQPATHAADAADAPVVPARRLRIATEGDFAPFNFIDEQGNPAGFDIDIARELCGRLQMECLFEARPWESLQAALISGDVDLLAASIRIPATLPDGIRFSTPYYGSRARFAGLADMSEASVPETLRTNGAQVAVQRDTVHAAYLEEIYPEIERVPVASLDEALRLVETGEAEVAFGDNAAILRWAKNRSCCRALGDPVDHPVYFGNGIAMAVRESDRDLLAAVNTALNDLVADGTYDAISARYFGGSIY